ncbi:MAG: OadG family protein [Bacteroidetes bacterium]|nr:OadG family protein [Bacteroidota bacterium]
MPIFRCEAGMITLMFIQNTAADTLKTAVSNAPAPHTTSVNELGFFLDRLTSVDINGNGNPILISVIGMGIVFLSLTFLYLTFAMITRMLNAFTRTRVMKAGHSDIPTGQDMSVSGEVNAAIAMALHLYLHQIRDEENTVITIKKIARTYSPWNSKIYNLRQVPQRTSTRRY